MIQADSVHSTPPTNASALTPQSSRRTFLIQATGAVAGGAALGASLPLPARSDFTATNCDAELIELGAKFEPLLDRYYVAHRRWSGALAQANAEHNHEFGTPAERNFAYRPEIEGAFLERCDRNGVSEADDAMDAIHRQMAPLANAINAAPIHSIEGLRVKALVTFWEIAPVQAGDTLYSFEDAYASELLFATVVELCGLKDKVRSTGYQLGDNSFACDESDDEREDA
jgi:hypothetical protein